MKKLLFYTIIIFTLEKNIYCMETPVKNPTLFLNNTKTKIQDLDICTFMIWVPEKDRDMDKVNMSHYFQFMEIRAVMAWVPSEYQRELFEEIGLLLKNKERVFKKRNLYEKYITDCFKAFDIIFTHNNYHCNPEKIVEDYKKSLENITILFSLLKDDILRNSKITLLKYIADRNPVKFINLAYPLYILLEEIRNENVNILEKEEKKIYDNIKKALKNCQ